MRHALRLLALLVIVAATLAGVPAVSAQGTPPLKATIFFTPSAIPPPPSDGVFFSGVPVPITIQIENTSGADVDTVDGFSGTEFFRRLYFTDPDGGLITNKIEEQTHGDSRFFTCLSRQRRLLSPGIPIVPVEVLAGQPHFFRQYDIPDARAFYDLSKPGTYTITAQIPLLVFQLGDPNALVADCDQVPGTNVNVASVSGRTPFTIVSNTLSFQISNCLPGSTDPSNCPPPLPPATTATVSPSPSNAGWITKAATVSFNAVSPPPGSPPGTPSVPIQRIDVSTSGAQVGSITIPGNQGSIVITADGQTNVAYQAVDTSGRIEAPKALPVNIDTKPPTITITTPTNGATYTQGQQVSASYACTDAASGVATCTGPVSSGSPIDTSTVGTNIPFTVTSSDVAGNTSSAAAQYTVVLGDTTPPTTTATPTPLPNASNWNNTDVTVTLSASDNQGGAGVKQIVYSATGAQQIGSTAVLGNSTQVTITAEGTTTLTYFATDNAGNVESPPKMLTIRIDKTAPTITVTTPASNATYTLNQSVLASYACLDGGSGVAACTGTVPTGSPIDTKTAGPKTFTVNATDNVGNAAAVSVPYTVSSDTTPPTTTATPSPTPNANGWNNSNVNVGLSSTDNAGGSGVKQITYSASGAQPIASTTVAGSSATVPLSTEGSTTVTYAAQDNAGNVEAMKSLTVRIDKTLPVLKLANITTDATSPAGAVVTYSATATDNLTTPTVACTPASGSTFPIGTTTVTCTATDAAGNRATGSFTVLVQAAAAQVLNLISTVQSFNIAQGITNSLDAKLSNVENALTSAQGGNVTSTCNQMSSFINETLAQSGKALTTDQANQLITAANRIKAVIGCP